jgi:hypothetical protein
MDKNPPTISIKDLSKAVEHAVKIASAKHNVQFSPEFRIGPGGIMGRQLMEPEIGSKQAEQIATEITQHVATAAAATLGATPLDPVVLIGRFGVVCGMIIPWVNILEGLP